MNYSVFIERYAQKQIMKLDRKVIPLIKEKIAELSNNPRPKGCSKLTSVDAWRIRIGDYRIIYEIDDKNYKVTIIAAEHRKSK